MQPSVLSFLLLLVGSSIASLIALAVITWPLLLPIILAIGLICGNAAESRRSR